MIEILATRRGNVERTEKMDDYARTGISEYWIVDPFDRLVEVYRINQGDYELAERSERLLHPKAFPELEIDMQEIWAELD